MNRQRKFRAWDGNKMLLSDEIGGFAIDDLSNEFWVDVMEYSNKKDKNGNIICEGDIILASDSVGFRKFLVEWDEDYTGLLPLHITNDEYDERIYNYNLVEIIGNKYETPELLNGVS